MNQDEVHELVMMLKKGLASGEIKIPEGSGVLASLSDVRFGVDGKVDPTTVSRNVMATALACAGAKTEREMRRIPLREVQAEYFEILDKFFGKPYSEMKAHGVDPAQVAEQLASQERFVSAFEADLEEFAAGIHDFWNHYAPVVELHLKEMNSLKSVFGGDVFPSYTANIACSVGLYMDTVILPDPLLRILSMAKASPAREWCRLIIKHALSALGYRDVALAEVDPPIVVIAADPMFLEPSYRSALEVTSTEDVLRHASKAFGRSFQTVRELNRFLTKIPTAVGLAAELREPGRFLFDSDWSGPFPEQFARYVRETVSRYTPGDLGSTVAETTYRWFSGRMMQTNDLLFRCDRYSGTPLIDAPTSWQYLLWKYEYDSRGSGLSEEVVISKAIASEGNTEFGMLSGVPDQALIELRQNGAMAVLRETIRTGLSEIDRASSDLVPRVANEVVAVIDRTFEEHDKQLRDITNSRRKFFGFDVTRWIAGGGLSVAAALSHNMGLTLLGAVAPSVMGAPSIPDLQKRWQELQSRSQDLQRSPAAILFKHLGHKFGFSKR